MQLSQAFRHNMATYAQFWGVLGRLLSPDMVYATVKFVAVCTRVAWFCHKSGGSNAHLLSEVLVDMTHIWICLIQNLRMHQTLKSL